MCIETQWNDGYIIEGLDRCHTIMIMIDELLVDHPAIIKASLQNDVNDVLYKINSIYQEIGNINE